MLSNIHHIPSLRVVATSALDEVTTKKISHSMTTEANFLLQIQPGVGVEDLPRWSARPGPGDLSPATRIFLDIFDLLLTLGEHFNVNIESRRSLDQASDQDCT